jgi:hypothetical protein
MMLRLAGEVPSGDSEPDPPLPFPPLPLPFTPIIVEWRYIGEAFVVVAWQFFDV